MKLLPDSYLQMRHKLFQEVLPVEDWHQVIAFEQIVINYLKMEQLCAKRF